MRPQAVWTERQSDPGDLFTWDASTISTTADERLPPARIKTHTEIVKTYTAPAHLHKLFYNSTPTSGFEPRRDGRVFYRGAIGEASINTALVHPCIPLFLS